MVVLQFLKTMYHMIFIVKPESKSPIPCPMRPRILTPKVRPSPLQLFGLGLADTIITWATTINYAPPLFKIKFILLSMNLSTK